MKFTEKYPNKPPIVQFVTPVYHPNISVTGMICVDLLNGWTPNLRIHDGLYQNTYIFYTVYVFIFSIINFASTSTVSKSK